MPRPGRCDVGKETRCPSYRRLGGPQGLSGRARKISSPTGFDLPALRARRAVYKVSCIVRDLKWTVTCNIITQGCLWKVNVCVGRQEKISIYGTWTNRLRSTFPTIIGRARRFAKSDYKIRHGCPSAWSTKAPTARIFMKFSIFAFSKIYINSSIFVFQSDKNNLYFTWRLFKFMTVSCRILHRMINVPDKSCRESQTHVLYSITFSPKIAPFWSNVENCGRAGEAKYDNTAHARCTLAN